MIITKYPIKENTSQLSFGRTIIMDHHITINRWFDGTVTLAGRDESGDNAFVVELKKAEAEAIMVRIGWLGAGSPSGQLARTEKTWKPGGLCPTASTPSTWTGAPRSM